MTDPAPHLGDRLSGLLDGELSAADEAAARAHVGECAFCTSELAAFARVRSAVRDLPAVDPAGGLRPVSRRRRPRLPAAGMAAAAAVAAAVALVAWAPADRPVRPDVRHLVETHAASGSENSPTQVAPVAVPVVLRQP